MVFKNWENLLWKAAENVDSLSLLSKQVEAEYSRKDERESCAVEHRNDACLHRERSQSWQR